MDSISLTAQNIKCGGCASNIQKGLGELDNVSTVEISIDTGLVTVSGENLSAGELSDKLAELGYPVSE